MAKKLSLSEAQLAASGKLPQQQDVMGDTSKAAKKSTVVRKHLAVVAPEPVVLDGTGAVAKDAKTKAALMRAEKRMEAKQGKVVAGKAQILDAEKVKQMIVLLDVGKSNTEVARQFGVAASHVSNIKRGVTWSHVTGRHYGGHGVYTKLDGTIVTDEGEFAPDSAEKPVPAAKATVVKSTAGQPRTGKGVPPSKASTGKVSTKKGGK